MSTPRLCKRPITARKLVNAYFSCNSEPPDWPEDLIQPGERESELEVWQAAAEALAPDFSLHSFESERLYAILRATLSPAEQELLQQLSIAQSAYLERYGVFCWKLGQEVGRYPVRQKRRV
jgi:hypothetical protein